MQYGLSIFSLSFGLTVWGSTISVTFAPFNANFRIQRDSQMINIICWPFAVMLHDNYDRPVKKAKSP